MTEVSCENPLVKIFFCHAIVAFKILSRSDRIQIRRVVGSCARSWLNFGYFVAIGLINSLTFSHHILKVLSW
jgi:hypothetical protein